MERGEMLNREGPRTIDAPLHFESKEQFGEGTNILESNPIKL